MLLPHAFAVTRGDADPNTAPNRPCKSYRHRENPPCPLPPYTHDALREVTCRHGRLRSPSTKPATGRQQDRSNRVLREVSKDTARPRYATLARGTGRANFRKRFRAGMEA